VRALVRRPRLQLPSWPAYRLDADSHLCRWFDPGVMATVSDQVTTSAAATKRKSFITVATITRGLVVQSQGALWRENRAGDAGLGAALPGCHRNAT